MYDAEALAKRGELIISDVLYSACMEASSRQVEITCDMNPRSSNGYYAVSSFSCGELTQAHVDGFLAAVRKPRDVLTLNDKSYKMLHGYIPAPYLVSRKSGRICPTRYLPFCQLVDPRIPSIATT